ncbi:MAG: UDP-N-acetylmuramoylalanyl-D-glutamyl-2,6-diaminopimelate/D-alanyl-D-alanyl ligase [Verrucomicrobiaceae bacterium]|nr:UDP-N-acetylmuramoylalanyl-D-glutamyl-2,6-diaminopimelate/D-alanyl-D-alanyl ligase [Verrucomicrobiaceae bacterium]
MKKLDLVSIAHYAGGRLLRGDGARLVTRVSTDSRTIQPGDVFIALAGDRFDGHRYLRQVSEAGAAAVIVSHLPEGWDTLAATIIKVEDTLIGLQRLAENYRTWHNPFVIGITGSNGKTSTKDLTCHLMASKYRVCATEGNLNNHIGLPLSILKLKHGDTCGVFEMGMNHPGEISPLAAIAAPDAAIITNIGVAHIEYMGSREAIALEKGMLAEAVPQGGVVVLNANDDFTPSIALRCHARVLRAGIGSGDVAAHDLKIRADGTSFTLDFAGSSMQAFLPLPGEHMVGNATLAAALAWHAGISAEQIVDALAKVKISKGRLETKQVHGITFVDDSYNANPDSMKAGLRTLAGLQSAGRRIAVLGRMGELGSHAEAGHREVGHQAAALNLDAVFTVGSEADLISTAASADNNRLKTAHFNTHEACAVHLKTELRPGDLVLLKGSRSSGMERVLALFQTS